MQLGILDLIIVCLSLVDLWFTYSYLNKLKSRGKGDYTQGEANVLIKFLIKKYGLKLGMVLSVLVLTSALGISLVVVKYGEYKWFLLGLYYMLTIQHFVNNNALNKLIKSEKEKKDGSSKRK